MNKPKICLIGCGSIGANKPDNIDGPETEFSLTHAHELYNLYKAGKIEEPRIFDKNIKPLETAYEKWGFPCGKPDDRFDIYVIAVNTEHQYSLIKTLMNDNPKLLIVEKPFCLTYKEASEISEIALEKNIPIIVNYTRKFIPAFREIKNHLNGDVNKKIFNVVLRYNRGLKREACHAIDLFNYWFGEFIDGAVLTDGYDDFNKTDRTSSVYLKYEKCDSIFLCPIDGRDYCLFEIDILTSNGKISFKRYGNLIETYPLIEDDMYGNYKTTFTEPQIQITDLRLALKNLYSNALAVYYKKSKPVCTDVDALKVHEVLFSLLEGDYGKTRN